MKMVRSLLLGTAAGFVALTGAQAADLPVKAKPVQYVKICDLYGAGYFYVPGTDTCMKIGGFVRFNAYWDQSNGATYGVVGAANGFYNRRDTQDFSMRARVYLTGDVRSQTAWGTLRSYYAFQVQTAGPNDVHTATATQLIRGFIQFAGFTLGRTTSLFDTPDATAFASLGNPGFAGNGTGPVGINAAQYTADLGNGISASIGIESAATRESPVVNLNRPTASFGLAGLAAIQNSSLSSGTGFSQWPELVANIDVTQAWGSARVAVAAHNASGDYYTGSGVVNGYVAPTGCVATTPTACGSPADVWGYAVTGGFTITAIPGLPGDLFGISAGYSHGASGYTTGVGTPSVVKGGSLATGAVTDGIFVNGSGIELTDVWFILGAYQHNWTPTLKTSIFGSYTGITYSSTAKNLICNPAAGGGAAGVVGAIVPAASAGYTVANCNPDFSYYTIGSRLFNWTPIPNLDIGLEVIYWNLASAHAGAAITPAVGANPAGIRTLGNQEVWTANFQVQRSFWP